MKTLGEARKAGGEIPQREINIKHLGQAMRGIGDFRHDGGRVNLGDV